MHKDSSPFSGSIHFVVETVNHLLAFRAWNVMLCFLFRLRQQQWLLVLSAFIEAAPTSTTDPNHGLVSFPGADVSALTPAHPVLEWG